MNIKELKQQVESNSLNKFGLIFELENESSRIILKQYLHIISKNSNRELKCINNIEDIPSNDSFIEDTNIYIYETDKHTNGIIPNNCVVICKSSQDKSKIKIPKLEDWQVIDYLKPKLPGITQQTLEALITIYCGNYFQFILDMEKLSLFEPLKQEEVLNLMFKEGAFDCYSDLTIWDLSNALIKKDINKVTQVLDVINFIDVEPIGLLTVMYKNFINIMNIQMNPKCTASDLGISDKQFYVMRKFNCGYYSNAKIIKILKILTDLEYQYKFNGLSISDLVDYIICGILGE